MIGNPLLLGDEGGYQISRSVRLRSSASAYLNRTFGTPTSGTTWTWSGWVKFGTIGSGALFEAGTGASNTFHRCTFGQVSQELNWRQVTPVGGLAAEKGTTQLFRDPSAWYHIVCVWDTNNGTAADRQRVYVNGVQVTAFSASTNPSSGLVSYFNTSGYVHYLGAVNIGGLGNYFDGYLTEINFIDGQALTPSSFGETNAVTGVWQPKKYGGTYGANGFYLNFSDNSGVTATTIGKDYSGNGNNWTPNNISVTAGVTYDSMTDVPTLTSATAANFATLNPLSQSTGGSAVPSNGNLTLSQATNNIQVASTIGMSAGKWYYEHTITVLGGENSVGIGPSTAAAAAGTTTGQYGYYYNGNKYISGAISAYGAAYTTGDVIGVAYDADTGSLTFYKNGTSQGVATTGITGTMFALAATRSAGGQNSSNLNFGQRPFSYTPPTGFVALNTYNLPAPTISNGASYMAATLYTGNGTSQTIANTVNGVNFQPDFVWVKGRSGATGHNLSDSVRGTASTLFSNTTGAENASSSRINAFNSNGFSVGNDTDVSTNTATYVGWQWNAGGSTVTNTTGTISAQVRANPTAGFSVVTYTGIGAARTVGHGLGVAPSFIIFKNRSAVSTWIVYSTAWSNPGTNYLQLNSTLALQNDGTGQFFNSTAATSSVFSIGTSNDVGGNGSNYVAYCFAPVAGYSAFGRYTGNGSTDGPFVYLGFRPRMIMCKRTDAISNWNMADAMRPEYNPADKILLANSSSAELSSYPVDFTANGFKVRNTEGGYNTNGGTHIYMAFAENPFKLSLAR